jgi:hypothetical protein
MSGCPCKARSVPSGPAQARRAAHSLSLFFSINCAQVVCSPPAPWPARDDASTSRRRKSRQCAPGAVAIRRCDELPWGLELSGRHADWGANPAVGRP